MELNEIDDSVLEAINRVRARAYGVEVSATGQYPAVAEREQTKLRTIIRTERRMELAFEQLRYLDPIMAFRQRTRRARTPICNIGSTVLFPRSTKADAPISAEPSKGSPHFSSRRPTNSRRGSSSPPKCTCGRSRTKLLRSCPISKTIPDIDPLPNDENRRPGTSVPGLFVYADAHAIRHIPVHSDQYIGLIID